MTSAAANVRAMVDHADAPRVPAAFEPASWEGVAPRIPDTPQRRRLQRQRDVREIVFGAKDGILTTMGIVTGLGAAGTDHVVVVVGGLLALFSGALSMGVGEYQGAKSEREVVRSAIEIERREMAADPEGEFAEQVAYYTTKGFTREEAEMIVRRLVQNPEIYLYEMMRDEFGIDPRIADESDVRSALAMAGAFAVGALLPVIPYFFPLHGWTALFSSAACALAGLFATGYYAGSLTTKNPVLRGLEIVAWGSAVFAVTFLAGRLIPALLGRPPVPIGG